MFLIKPLLVLVAALVKARISLHVRSRASCLRKRFRSDRTNTLERSLRDASPSVQNGAPEPGVLEIESQAEVLNCKYSLQSISTATCVGVFQEPQKKSSKPKLRWRHALLRPENPAWPRNHKMQSRGSRIRMCGLSPKTRLKNKGSGGVLCGSPCLPLVSACLEYRTCPAVDVESHRWALAILQRTESGLTSGSKGSIGSAPVSPLLPHRSSSRRHPLTSAANRARSADPAPFTAKTRKYSDSSPGGLSEPDSGLLSALESGSATNTRSPSDSSEETTAWPPPPSEIQDKPRRESLTLNLQLRDEGYSWRTASTTSEGTGSPANSPRPQTPAFPVHPRTPYSNGSAHSHFDLSGLPPKSPTAARKEWSTLGETLHRELSSTSSRGYDSSDNQHSPKSPVFSNGTLNGGHSSPSPTVYYGTSRRSSIHSNGEPPQEVSPAHVKFVRDTSKCWYKATISREE
ncbi:unnamed protein product, partial [Nesidiocoris tenuis]